MPTGNRMLPGGDLEGCQPVEPSLEDFIYRAPGRQGSVLITGRETPLGRERREAAELQRYAGVPLTDALVEIERVEGQTFSTPSS